MLQPKLLQGSFLVCRNALPKLGHLREKVLHHASGLKENEHLPLVIAHFSERMRDLPRRKRRVARPQFHQVIAHLCDELATNYIIPFVLKMMTMKRRSPLRLTHGVIDAKITTRIPPRDLQIKSTA